MESHIKTPEEHLKYRPLRRILADKPAGVHAVAPGDTVFTAMGKMAQANIGFLAVLDRERLVGVLSERDYARKVMLQGRSSADTPVRDIMTADVVTVTPENTLPQCMALMNQHGFRHLPVVENGKISGVLSIRDLLREIVAHHERVIRDLDLERMTMMSGGSSY